MKLELTESQAAILRPLVRDRAGMFKTQVVIAQVMPGDWQAPEKLWLIYSTISKPTANKIRKLIEKEHAVNGGVVASLKGDSIRQPQLQ